MDTRTGHLVADLSTVPDTDRKNYTPIPNHLRDDAAKELAGRAEATVYVKGMGKLAGFAQKENAKRRVRAKIAKRSRKAGRK